MLLLLWKVRDTPIPQPRVSAWESNPGPISSLFCQRATSPPETEFKISLSSESGGPLSGRLTQLFLPFDFLRGRRTSPNIFSFFHLFFDAEGRPPSSTSQHRRLPLRKFPDRPLPDYLRFPSPSLFNPPFIALRPVNWAMRLEISSVHPPYVSASAPRVRAFVFSLPPSRFFFFILGSFQ